VPNYRFYKVRLDGHVVGGPTVITCDDDEQAIAQARRLTDGYGVEIWELGRFITKIKKP
jgi:hypothetical protein